jgi:hypothetical protein
VCVQYRNRDGEGKEEKRREEKDGGLRKSSIRGDSYLFYIGLARTSIEAQRE